MPQPSLVSQPSLGPLGYKFCEVIDKLAFHTNSMCRLFVTIVVVHYSAPKINAFQLYSWKILKAIIFMAFC